MAKMIWIVIVMLPVELVGQIRLANPKNAYVYRGIENPIQVTQYKGTWDSLEVSVNQGKLKGVSKLGEYIYSTDSLGFVEFTVVNKMTKQKTSFKYPVLDIPLPVAKLGGNYGGTITTNLLSIQEELKADLIMEGSVFGHAITKIDSFSMLIVRQDSVIYSESTKGPRFSEKSRQAFLQLRKGDKLIVYNIMVFAGGTSKKRRLNPIEFTVTE